jgi:hypothetical protein
MFLEFLVELWDEVHDVHCDYDDDPLLHLHHHDDLVETEYLIHEKLAICDLRTDR